MSGEKVHKGGCLCGAVRYRIVGSVPPGAHCHCSMCRKASGGTFVTWITAPIERFEFVHGQPAVHKSSDHGERRFCRDCGSLLTFWSRNSPQFIDITTASLDNPGDHRPDRHIWTSGRLPWLRIDDDLPQYPEWTPPHHWPASD